MYYTVPIIVYIKKKKGIDFIYLKEKGKKIRRENHFQLHNSKAKSETESHGST